MSYRPHSDPWFSRKVLKFHIAKNTFAVFSQYGGLGLYGLPPTGSVTQDIGVDDCRALLQNMRHWLGSPTAQAEAIQCSTDIDYVRYQVDWVQSCLGKESNQKYLGVMFILDGWDDRQTDEDNRRADAYCHRLYSSSPYDD
ncbi:hypothetical protein BVY11_22640 [Pseudomonas amygdali pv. morsprunorum]|nr:hypothetical protein BVY11_22640 [Pseudomonas amygdali pv. morsprunorum]PPS26661.1 hypothetical protein BVY12_27565 [Pseudomonas amygdali pv. morsprunorum]